MPSIDLKNKALHHLCLPETALIEYILPDLTLGKQHSPSSKSMQNFRRSTLFNTLTAADATNQQTKSTK